MQRKQCIAFAADKQLPRIQTLHSSIDPVPCRLQVQQRHLECREHGDRTRHRPECSSQGTACRATKRKAGSQQQQRQQQRQCQRLQRQERGPAALPQHHSPSWYSSMAISNGTQLRSWMSKVGPYHNHWGGMPRRERMRAQTRPGQPQRGLARQLIGFRGEVPCLRRPRQLERQPSWNF